jgi:hypothetical protein
MYLNFNKVIHKVSVFRGQEMKPLHGRPDRLIGQEGQNRRFVRIRLNPSIIAEMTITVLDGKKVKSRPAKVMLRDLNQQGLYYHFAQALRNGCGE